MDTAAEKPRLVRGPSIEERLAGLTRPSALKFPRQRTDLRFMSDSRTVHWNVEAISGSNSNPKACSSKLERKWKMENGE